MSDYENVLKSVAERQGFKQYETTLTSAFASGAGYQGIITAAEIRDTADSDKEALRLVVKSAPTNDVFRRKMLVDEGFEREIYMYERVVPAFQKLAGKATLHDFVKCYKTVSARKAETLVLDNLNAKGFKMWDRRIPIDGEHVRLIMETLGRLHALSFALKDKEPDVFDALTKPMKEDDVYSKVFKTRDMPEVLVSVCNNAAKTLSPSEDAAALKAFEKFTAEASKIAHEYKYVEDHVVILHGDCWINNMMFAYDDEKNPNTPTDMYLIDLQMARVGPPVIDILYYFHTSSSMEVISNFEAYLDIYHNSLSARLEALGSDAKDLYSYAVFRQQWRDHVKYGLLTVLFLTRLTVIEEEDDLHNIPKSDRNFEEVYTSKIVNIDQYNARVKQLILHFVENKFI